jgi:hypothetical protein
MTPSTRKHALRGAVAVALLSAAALAYPASVALSQHQPMTGHGMPMPDGHTMPGHHGMQNGQAAGHQGAGAPTMPGQDAFGAVQEIVRILEADPETDWSKVDLEGLRQHLVDMNEVTLRAKAAAKPIEGGVEIAVTGEGRTRAAIQRMIPAHAQELDRLAAWSARTAPLPDGVLLTLTSSDPKDVPRIRGLGFIGLLVSGAHHQPHHLATAKGAFHH